MKHSHSSWTMDGSFVPDVRDLSGILVAFDRFCSINVKYIDEKITGNDVNSIAAVIFGLKLLGAIKRQ